MYYSFIYVLQLCLKYHDYHNLCMYHAALSYASLGKFYESLKLLVSNSKKMITPQASTVWFSIGQKKYKNFENCLLSVWVLFNIAMIGKCLIKRL